MSNQKGRNIPSAYIFSMFLKEHPEKHDAVVGYDAYPKMRNAIRVKLSGGKIWLFQICGRAKRVLNCYPMAEKMVERATDKISMPAVSDRGEENLVADMPPEIKEGDTLYWLRDGVIVPVSYVRSIGRFVDDHHLIHVAFMIRSKADHVYRDDIYKAGEEWRMNADDIGKELFLTYSEAEAALAAKQKEEIRS